MTQPERIETAAQFADNPSGWAQRWQVELQAARDNVRKWHEQGDKVVKRFLDERDGDEDKQTRWNLFTANVETQQALLYGQTPKVDVTRRFGDSADDVARVAGEVMSRHLNCDIESEDDTYAEALRLALEDRLLPGMGTVRVRYAVDMEPVPAQDAVLDSAGAVLVEAVEEGERKSPGSERVETDYVYWKDFMWSPARVWRDVRWVAFKADMSREQLVTRFGKDIGSQVPLGNGLVSREDRDKGTPDPWARAEVWEVWDKPSRRVFWYVEGFGSVLDAKEDPLRLLGFFPCPKPLVGHTTTRAFMPRPDFVIAQDLYNEIDQISTRVALLTNAIRAAGVYDKQNVGVQRLLSDASNNELIPVDNWALFAEKGGVRGAVDWLPLDQIVNAITALDQRREVAKAALYEVTGMSDLLRGQAAASNVTATEQSIKARFASVRLQRLQDEFARFASDVQRLKAHIIATQFDDDTILARSNVMMTPDAPLAGKALAFIRDQFAQYRIEVKPESVSLSDFAAMQDERNGVLQAVTTFITAAAPLAQQMPGSMPFLLQMLQWFVSGQRGSSEIEGVLDQAIAAAQQMQQTQAQQPQQPDPKLLVAQLKEQGDLQKIEKESQARLVELQAEVQADAQREQNQMVYNVKEAALKQQIGDASRSQQQARQPPRGQS